MVIGVCLRAVSEYGTVDHTRKTRVWKNEMFAARLVT